MATLFRWSIWGDKRHLAQTLPYSVKTFRHAFGDDAKYIVHTDEPSEVKAILYDEVDVRHYGESSAVLFDVDARATWKKWCPTPRLDVTSTEFYVDADVFLIGDPTELRRFSAGRSACSFLAFQEAADSRHKVGKFAPRILAGIPPINTGFLGQGAGADISRELLAELDWWQKHLPITQRESHDDQGAVVAVLARYYLVGRVELLPQERYCIVSPTSNRHLTNLSGVAAIHATYPDHPAFQRFKGVIENYLASEKPCG